ncbi:uncharacterized protein LOC126975546 [Leptidea sinapis]|uniref:uncharacterized protein LOC126975546 n=1 Tax=Leptidea sinapis TaxID=189913 RepID=UPI0021C466E0|nr:uncharacterized protein LOC126975546 [Leptidea sinapis]
MWRGEGTARPAASPGLLRRRYSVPETIMRKYRLAQQRSDSDERQESTSPASTALRGVCNCCSRGPRRDRDPIRKSALLRLWGRAGASPVRNCCCQNGTRSLDGSHSELRGSPRSTPKRLRLDSSRDTDSSFRFHRALSPYLEHTITPVSEKFTTSSTSQQPSETITAQIESEFDSNTLTDKQRTASDDCSITDSSDALTTSFPTMKRIEYNTGPACSQINSLSSHIDGRVSERSISAENDESNILPYDKPLTIETDYDILEIVVSETHNPKSTPAVIHVPAEKKSNLIKNATNIERKKDNVDIDEYVSNILVESLNSLTDQLESMNASMGYDKKLNIVEKEIKVRLQNTGVNTIVHLSPTSNNQIIFGNEELCNNDYGCDVDNNPRENISDNVRESALSIETNNNITSAESLRDSHCIQNQNLPENCVNVPNDNINKSILSQIQKLFQDELKNSDLIKSNTSLTNINGVSHIEISNVDIFLNDSQHSLNNTDTIEIQTQNFEGTQVLGGVGTGNYFEETEEKALVPRFSAYPHSDSMEVNTSSSEDMELLGSECGSLVDSLDDPNSPRSLLLRRAYTNSKRSELVRSSIDVLDLLPENASQNSNLSSREKGEAFFIRIKDNDLDCEKENVVVADHMPETIKQRLLKRHRKREQRMESARRNKVRQLKNDVIKNEREHSSYKTKKEIEKECFNIINSLINDVIAKIAQDEYKCMRIKQRSNKTLEGIDANLPRKAQKKESETAKLNKRKTKLSDDIDKQHRKAERHIREKFCQHVNSMLSPEEQRSKRIYQKSEIHEGNNCIEILEILEYVNSSQTSSETTNSDDNHSILQRNKKSRIPVPVYERIQKIRAPKIKNQEFPAGSLFQRDKFRRSNENMPGNFIDDFDEGSEDSIQEPPMRRASVPYESRARSNSMRFQIPFDIIPEEKSSLSLESNDDISTKHHASAPSLSESLSNGYDKHSRGKENGQQSKDRKFRNLKNVSTSPMPETHRAATQVNAAAMTSPLRKSASTSPIRTSPLERYCSNGLNNTVSQQRPTQRRDKEGIARTFSHPLSAHRTASTIYVDQTALTLFKIHQTSYSKNDKLNKNNDKYAISSRDRKNSVTTQYEEQIKKNIGTGTEMQSVNRKGNKIKAQNCFKNKLPTEIDIKKKVKEKNCRTHSNDIDYEEMRRERLSTTRERKSDQRNVATERSREDDSTSSSDSGGSLLCSLAPAWLSARRRRRRAATHSNSGEWAVTVAGSCAAALPNDVEMRLRFPEARERLKRAELLHHPPYASAVECGTDSSRVSHARRPAFEEVDSRTGRLTLTLKKEASDSSLLASKSVKKSNDLLPDLETYRASRSKTKSSMKTRRGYSLHCWLPEDDPAIRPRNGLSVLGSAIVPEQKPRVPTMSERDLTRIYSTRRRFSYLRA